MNQWIETDPVFYKRLVYIATPIAMQSLITQGVNMIDTIMLGALGETALSAASLGNQFIGLFSFCCMGISMGASVLIARFWGAGDMKSLKKATTVAIRTSVVLAVLVTVINVLFSRQIIRIYTPDPKLVESGAIYLLWSSPTFFLMAMSLTATGFLRSIGQTRIPFLGSAVAFVVNIGANYIFIFGKFGVPALGVAGAALGTVIARIVESCIVCGYVLYTDRQVEYRIRDMCKPCGEILREFVKISLPVLVSDGLLGVGESILAVVMGHIGSGFVSANAITSVTWRVCTVLITAVSSSSSVVTGHTLGQGDVWRAQKQGYTFLLLGAFFGMLGGLAIFLLRPLVVNAYNVTVETRNAANQMMLSMSILMMFRAANSILTKGVLRAGGDTRFLMVADVLLMWIVSIPLGAAAGLVWKLNAFWIFFCLHIDQILKCIWCYYRLRSGKWIKRIKGVST